MEARHYTALALALAAAVAALIYLTGEQDGRQGPLATPISPSAAREVDDQGAEVGQDAPARDHVDIGDAVPTRGELLEAFWGEEYQEIMDQAVRHGVDLDGPSADCLPWDEVEGKILQMLQANSPDISTRVPPIDSWPDEVTPEFLSGQFGAVAASLSESELRAVDAIAKPFSSEISYLGAQRDAAMLGAMTSQFQAGNFDRSPYFIPESEPVHDLAIRRVIHTDGWCVDLCVKNEDWPLVEELNEQIESQKTSRHDAVAEYLKLFE